MSTLFKPTSKDVTIRTLANGYQVQILGLPANNKPAVFTDTASLLANITAYFENPSIIPWSTSGTSSAAQ